MSTVKRLRPCWGRPNWTRNFPYRGAARLRSACRGAGVLIIGVVCFVVGFVLGGRSSINSTNSEETVRKFLKPAHRIAVASHTQPQHPDVSPVFKSKINGPISYVQVSTQRSGSTWLVRLLNAHPQIYDQGEVFLNPAKHAKLKVGRPKSDRYLDIATTSKMAETPLTVGRLKLILGMAFEAPSAGQATQIKRRLGGTPVEKGKSAPRLIATGFKWMLNQGLESHREHALRYLRENQVRVIVLARRNLLRQCISLFDMQHRQGSPHVIVTRKGTVLNDHRIESRQWDIPKGFFIKCFRKYVYKRLSVHSRACSRCRSPHSF